MSYKIVMTRLLAERDTRERALAYATTVRCGDGERVVVIRHEEETSSGAARVLARVSPEEQGAQKSAAKGVPGKKSGEVPRAKQKVVKGEPRAEEGRGDSGRVGSRGKKDAR